MTASVILLAALCAATDVAKPVMIKNEDNEHIFMEADTVGENAVGFGEKALVEYVDRMTKGKALTHVFYCTCGQRASFDSEAWEPIWYGMDEKDFMGRTNYSWKVRAKAYRDSGIDPYKVMVRRTRDNQVSPWMSMRVNDTHFLTTDRLSRTTRFWRDHPEFRIYPNEKALGSKRPWYDFSLDFVHKEVRDYNFAMARELLTRYDCDGLELDFLRCIPCLRYEHAEEDAHYLTEFVRRVRKAARRAAEDKDHPVGLAVRIPQDLRCAHKLGFEIEKWTAEKLVDIVVLGGESTASFEIDYRKTAALLKAQNPDVIVLPMIDRVQCADECFPMHVDLAGYRGWADAMYAKGVDGLYLFNLEYSSPDVQRGVYAGALAPANVVSGHRRYIATCDDVPSKIMKPREKALLSAGLDKALEIPVWAGKSLPTKQVEVILGFDSEEVPAEKLAVSLNGRPCLGFVEEPATGPYCGAKRWTCMRSLKVYCWRFPFDAFATGLNKVTFSPVAGAKARICWCEVALDR